MRCTMKWVIKGRVWKFGDNVDIDDLDFETADWEPLYDTRDDEKSANKGEYFKLKAAAHALYTGVEEEHGRDGSPFRYMSCDGEYTICEWPGGFLYGEEYEDNEIYMVGDTFTYVVRLTVYT